MPKEKKCKDCGEKKPLSEFYKHKGMADEHLNSCKVCRLAYIKEYNKTEKGRKVHLKASRKYKLTDKGRDATLREQGKKPNRIPTPKMKGAAIQAVFREVESGRMKPARSYRCRMCKEKRAVHYHHYLGYEERNRLDVVPLCRSCHKYVHGG